VVKTEVETQDETLDQTQDQTQNKTEVETEVETQDETLDQTQNKIEVKILWSRDPEEYKTQLYEELAGKAIIYPIVAPFVPKTQPNFLLF